MAKRKVTPINWTALDTQDLTSPIRALLVERLRGTEFENKADLLADEFEAVGINPDTIHNAPVLCKTTHGVDIYKLIAVLQQTATEAAAGGSK